VKAFKSWFTNKVEKSGMIPMPKKAKEMIGGHAICVVGYNNQKDLFKFKNSWDRVWGDGGYGYLPYKYMEKYCTDAWSATDLIENPKALVKKLEQIIKEFKSE
jgi:C1A family cysteine protease